MRFVPFHALQTDRLYLRKLRLEDIHEYNSRLFGSAEVTRYMLFQPHPNLEESKKSLQRKVDKYKQDNFYCWGITSKEEDSLVGLVELLRLDAQNNSCSFVYMLGHDFWNQGYGTEALKAVFQFAFKELGVERIAADHISLNTASGAVMRKAGMNYMGTIEGKYEKQGVSYDADCYEIRNPGKQELTANEYQKLAMTTLNPELSKKDVLINGVMGLCGESGEAIDIVKKWLAQGHELDKEKLAKELGDIAWYLAETAYALEIPLEDILLANIEKLKKRYPEGFDSNRSIHR